MNHSLINHLSGQGFQAEGRSVAGIDQEGAVQPAGGRRLGGRLEMSDSRGSYETQVDIERIRAACHSNDTRD